MVITLTSDTDGSRTPQSQKTFLTPTVYHFAAPFVVWAIAIAPDLPTAVVSIGVALPALLGLAIGLAVSRA